MNRISKGYNIDKHSSEIEQKRSWQPNIRSRTLSSSLN